MILLYNRKTRNKNQKSKKNKNNYIGPWTIKEDRTLIQLVEQQGPAHWNLLANFLPGRTGKQCRERWCNHLCPNINKSSWSLEEEMLLLLIHNKKGNKWSEIAKYLKGRTDNTIKNHWNSSMKKKLKFVEESLKNKKIEIKNRYKENKDEKIEKLLIEEFMDIIQTQMKKVFDDKQKNYENFKKIEIEINTPTNNEKQDLENSINNNNNDEIINTNIKISNTIKIKNKSKETNDVINLRKILGFRTHSKKGKNPRKKIKINTSLSSSSSKKKLKKIKDKKNKKILNEVKDEFELEKQIIENKNNNKDNDSNYKTPNINKIINKISSSMKQTDENSETNKILQNDNKNNNISAFHFINREDNAFDKKLLLWRKYTPVKIITELEDKTIDKNESEKSEIKNSKKNLSIIFNNLD